jgi:hypothetical protein
MTMPNRNSKSGLAALALFALVATPVALLATPASARVDVGVNFGVPVIVAPPVVVAPPPVVYAAPPPVVYAQPPVVYAQPPVAYAPAPVAVVGGGYWAYDHHGRRYWQGR